MTAALRDAINYAESLALSTLTPQKRRNTHAARGTAATPPRAAVPHP